MNLTTKNANSLFGEDLESLRPYRHVWPPSSLSKDSRWMFDEEHQCYLRNMPESLDDLGNDSRWPAMFPSPISIITARDGDRVAMEREVGASIVNRFPYVVALSICRETLSSRHHKRSTFMEILEKGGVASLQFLPPGDDLDTALNAIDSYPDAECTKRIQRAGFKTHMSVTNEVPWLAPAYLVYEAALVRPQRDFDGNLVCQSPWEDVGSHRIYFLEITAIQLRHDIATNKSKICWQALPSWSPKISSVGSKSASTSGRGDRYQKGYNPNYTFPSSDTIAFDFDEVKNGMAIKHLPPLPEDQVEVDNDRARWPCFFPSSCGLITTWADDGAPNLMPCGSTTIVSRHPFVVAPCISYAKINERYAARKTLDFIRREGRFGCGVPFLSDSIVNAIKYSGNNSFVDDPEKINNSGLNVEDSKYAPVISDVPVHFSCKVIGEKWLGTHIMFFGEVEQIRVRADVTPENPLVWHPWAAVT